MRIKPLRHGWQAVPAAWLAEFGAPVFNRRYNLPDIGPPPAPAPILSWSRFLLWPGPARYFPRPVVSPGRYIYTPPIVPQTGVFVQKTAPNFGQK